MPLLIDSITQAGKNTRPNEDRFGNIFDRLWIIDGATGQGDESYIDDPLSSDAEWLAGHLNGFLIRNAVQPFRVTLLHNARTEILSLFKKSAKKIPEVDYAWPSAAISLVHVGPETLTCLSLGDCTVLFQNKNGEVFGHKGDPIHQELDRQVVEKFIKMRQAGTLPADAELHNCRQALLPLIHPNRALANRDGGYGSFTLATPLREDFMRLSQRRTSDISHVLLMTDGFYDIVEAYKAMTDRELMEYALEHGLENIMQKTRAIENTDPYGITYPRLKRSDDATAALYSI